MAISITVNPTDHTSEETVYVPRLFCDSPLIRSGYGGRAHQPTVTFKLNEITHRHITLTTDVGFGQRFLQLP